MDLRRDICDRRYLMSVKHEFSTAARWYPCAEGTLRMDTIDLPPNECEGAIPVYGATKRERSRSKP